MNIIQIMGRLGADPEKRTTQSGVSVTTFNVGTTIRQNGENKTVWYRVSFFEGKLENMLKHLKKGSAVVVVGSLMPPRTYQKNGETRVALELRGDMLSFSPFGEKKEEPKKQEVGVSQSDWEIPF